MSKMSREIVRRHRRLLECREGRREASTYKSARVIKLWQSKFWTGDELCGSDPAESLNE
jgi:hypothetical protein